MSQPWVNADPAHPCPAGSEAVRAADARHTIEEGPSLFKLRHDDEPSLLSAPLFPQVSGALCLVSRAGRMDASTWLAMPQVQWHGTPDPASV